MGETTQYQTGQRWFFQTDVPEFEATLVIGKIKEAHPEWGDHEIKYHVYVKYAPQAAESLLPDIDGVILSLTAEGLDRSVTQLVEENVELPWWWIYGLRIANERDKPRSSSVKTCDRACDPLSGLFQDEKCRFKESRRREESIRRHFLKFDPATIKVSPSQSIGESWARIATWMAEHAPGLPFQLNPGASDQAIAGFEKAIGVSLPDDFKESVRLHDGGEGWIVQRHGDLLSLEQILAQWQRYKGWQEEGNYADEDSIPSDIQGPIKRIFWNLKRIYFTDCGGDHFTLDLDPPKRGKYGQILDHCHEVGPRKVIATSWTEFLQNLVSDLESGRYVYFEDQSLEPLEEVQKSVITVVKPSPAAADDAADDDAAADDAEDDEDEDDDAEDDEDEDEDVLAPTVYETQEFVFYLGDRNLGSYFMPVYGKAQPDSIERRMITAPTMTNVGYPMLLWVEETDDGAKTMMWSADTPAEIVEAQRLFDTAQTAQKAADAAESKETE